MTIQSVREAAAYWAEKLRLNDWEITVQFADNATMNKHESDGLAMWSAEHRTAVILLRRKQDDIEGTLVHELLHVAIQGHIPQTAEDQYDVAEERAVNSIADALVGFHRCLPQ